MVTLVSARDLFEESAHTRKGDPQRRLRVETTSILVHSLAVLPGERTGSLLASIVSTVRQRQVFGVPLKCSTNGSPDAAEDARPGSRSTVWRAIRVLSTQHRTRDDPDYRSASARSTSGSPASALSVGSAGGAGTRTVPAPFRTGPPATCECAASGAWQHRSRTMMNADLAIRLTR